MPYFFNTDEDRKEMLEAIGADSVDSLFDQIPKDLQLDRLLDFAPAMDELTLHQHMSELATRNQHAGQKVCFLGGGCYDHYIPSVVDALASRGEFYTSYTPYQAEVSQGNLQAMFEYQTLICQLTGMDVSNASLYDGGSASVEAVLMAMSTKPKRKKVVTSKSVHPEYRQIIETYFLTLDAELEIVEATDGKTDLEAFENAVDDETACVLIQHPNFFGNVEEMEKLVEIARAKDAVVIHSFDPMSLGLLKTPGDYGADIAIAEGQSLGSSMAYGGPFLGIMACKDSLIRRMPGRIAGQTVARGDKRCWVLTLQTREQHIRRDKATSNICTNQGLYALRASIFLAVMGPHGMREAAELCVRKSHYASESICQSERFEVAFPSSSFFKETVIRDKENRVSELLKTAEDNGFFAGIALGKWYPELEDCFLVTVTEKRSKSEIDSLAQTLSQTIQKEVAHA